MKRIKLLLTPDLSERTEKNVREFLSEEWPQNYSTELFDGRLAILLNEESRVTEIEGRFPGIVQDVKYFY